jgi:predicted RNA-binding protein with PIN domain
MNEENYGTEVSIEELKGHYKAHFLTADQFIDLVQEWYKNEVKKINNTTNTCKHKWKLTHSGYCRDCVKCGKKE